MLFIIHFSISTVVDLVFCACTPPNIISLTLLVPRWSNFRFYTYVDCTETNSRLCPSGITNLLSASNMTSSASNNFVWITSPLISLAFSTYFLNARIESSFRLLAFIALMQFRFARSKIFLRVYLFISSITLSKNLAFALLCNLLPIFSCD